MSINLLNNRGYVFFTYLLTCTTLQCQQQWNSCTPLSISFIWYSGSELCCFPRSMHHCVVSIMSLRSIDYVTYRMCECYKHTIQGSLHLLAINKHIHSLNSVSCWDEVNSTYAQNESKPLSRTTSAFLHSRAWRGLLDLHARTNNSWLLIVFCICTWAGEVIYFCRANKSMYQWICWTIIHRIYACILLIARDTCINCYCLVVFKDAFEVLTSAWPSTQ